VETLGLFYVLVGRIGGMGKSALRVIIAIVVVVIVGTTLRDIVILWLLFGLGTGPSRPDTPPGTWELLVGASWFAAFACAWGLDKAIWRAPPATPPSNEI
jgi:hypothetical protein